MGLPKARVPLCTLGSSPLRLWKEALGSAFIPSWTLPDTKHLCYHFVFSQSMPV